MSDLSPLLRKLEAHGKFPKEDREAVLGLPFTTREVAPATYLIREGEPPRVCTVLLSGYAFRHKIVANGGRQIVSLHIPGEAIDFEGIYLNCSDHNAQALTRAEVATIPMAAIRRLLAERPTFARAVLLDMLVEASVLREWVTNIGRRDSKTRLAHLSCEFATRTSAQGVAGCTYELPMTQEQIGDALGLTSVHVNRSIRALESEGLITRNKRLLNVPDLARLREAGDFSDLYLHADPQHAV